MGFFPFCFYTDSTDYCFVAYYDFFIRNNLIELDQKTLQPFNEYKEAVKCNSFLNLWFENACFIIKPPIFINRDEQGRLHSTHSKAIEFRDGYGEYYVNGVHFSEELFVKAFKDKSISAKEIVSLKNLEQKSVLLDHYGTDIWRETKHRVVDKGTHFNRHKQEQAEYFLIEIDLGGYVQRYVVCEDYSTPRKYLLPVPAPGQVEDSDLYDLDSWRGCVAWTCKDPKYWDKLKVRT